MIIAKRTFNKLLILLAIVLTLINCKKMEPEFKIYGDEDLLKDIKINIKFTRDHYENGLESKLVTALYKGKRYKVQGEYTFIYTFYLSYKDSLVTVREMENIMQYADGYINHLYIKKDEKDQIYLFYVGMEANIKKGWGFSTPPIMSLQKFFEKENITHKEEQEKYKNYFFNFYNPETSSYKEISEIPEYKNEDKTVYKTYKGKNYTLEEWENFEQKQWEYYSKKNNIFLNKKAEDKKLPPSCFLDF